MTRWKASFIHLSISAAIAMMVLALMLMVWYPHPFFSAVGGQQVLMILLGVDVTLGPLATLAIFNPKKSRRTLSFDLSIIAILQLAALIYGMSVVFQARPAYVVFTDDAFNLVTANVLQKDDIAKVQNPDFRSPPLTGPIYVYTEMPKDSEKIMEVIKAELNGQFLSQLPQFYLAYAEHMTAVGQTSKPLDKLRELNPDNLSEIDEAVLNSGRTESDLGYLPLRANYRDLAVLVGRSDGKVLSVLMAQP